MTKLVRVQLLKLLGRDHTNLVVLASKVSAAVDNGMDMKFGCRWFSGQLTDPLDQSFHRVVVQIVLFSEEDYATPRNYNDVISNLSAGLRRHIVLVMARSRSSSSEFGASNHCFKLASGNSRPMTVVTSNELNWSNAPLSLSGSLCEGAGGAVAYSPAAR